MFLRIGHLKLMGYDVTTTPYLRWCLGLIIQLIIIRCVLLSDYLLENKWKIYLIVYSIGSLLSVVEYVRNRTRIVDYIFIPFLVIFLHSYYLAYCYKKISLTEHGIFIYFTLMFMLYGRHWNSCSYRPNHNNKCTVKMKIYGMALFFYGSYLQITTICSDVTLFKNSLLILLPSNCEAIMENKTFIHIYCQSISALIISSVFLLQVLLYFPLKLSWKYQ
ncbi:hypothetical protein SNEBB_001399 [Seison nebaliae]|nr:hypothetical protein SNEBB_001399 [Seison nebaliae]